ncbi:MAG: hypothetical protein WCO75_08165 [Planctomycetota bacterium]
MTDTAASANAACSSSASCCASNCCCPCEGRIKKLEKTVCRIRFWLFISLGVLILLIGIAIGKGNGHDRDGGDGRREEIRRVEIMGGAMPGDRMMGAPMMGGGPERRPNMGGEGRGEDAPKQKKRGKDKD